MDIYNGGHVEKCIFVCSFAVGKRLLYLVWHFTSVNVKAWMKHVNAATVKTMISDFNTNVGREAIFLFNSR